MMFAPPRGIYYSGPEHAAAYKRLNETCAAPPPADLSNIPDAHQIIGLLRHTHYEDHLHDFVAVLSIHDICDQARSVDWWLVHGDTVEIVSVLIAIAVAAVALTAFLWRKRRPIAQGMEAAAVTALASGIRQHRKIGAYGKSVLSRAKAQADK